MKKRGLFIVVGAVFLCLLLGVYLLLVRSGTEETAATEEEVEDEEIVSISEDEIAKLSFELDSGEVTWVKEDDVWYLSSDREFPVDESKISTLISAVSSISAERTLDDVSNLKDYGLESPVNVITVEKTDESTEVINVGNKNPSTGDTYIYLNDESDTVYTIGKDLGSTFSGGIYDFAVSEDYPAITSSTITSIKVDKKANAYTLQSDGDSSTGYYITDENGDRKEADSTNAGTLQSTVAGLSYSGYYEYDCDDWAAYGLDEPKMELVVDYTEQVEVEADATETDDGDEDETDASGTDDADETETDTSGTDDADETETKTVQKSLVLYVGDLGDDGNYYVRLGDSQEVHGMSQAAIDTLMNAKAFDYWKLSIESMAISDLDHLDVTYGGETHTLKRVVTVESSETDAESDGESEDGDSADADSSGSADVEDSGNADSSGSGSTDSSSSGSTDSSSSGSTDSSGSESAGAGDSESADSSGSDSSEINDSSSNDEVSSDGASGEDSSAEDTADSSEEAETITTYYVDDKEADSQTFMKFYRAALAMTCQSRLEEYEEQNEPEIKLEYYGTDGSKVTIEYISRDSNFYTVADQDGNYGLVNKMNVKDLISQWINLMNEQEKK